MIVKADAGTYGMGIMTVHDAADVRGLNRKQRNKMAVVKEGLEVHVGASSRKACRRSSRSTTRSPSPSST